MGVIAVVLYHRLLKTLAVELPVSGLKREGSAGVDVVGNV